MPIECEKRLRYCANMTNNPHAQLLFEFIESNGLSLNKIALAASISHGTLRAFRDIDGRKFNRTTAIAIAQALHQLTSKPVDASALFGEQFTKAEVESINAPTNTKFCNLLAEKRILPKNLAKLAKVDEGDVLDILHGRAAPAHAVEEISQYLNVNPEELLPQSPEDTSHLPTNLPIKRIYQLKEDGEEWPGFRYQDFFISNEVLANTVRPPTLKGCGDAYALYMPDTELWPMVPQDTLIYVAPEWQAGPGDLAVVTIRNGAFAGHSFFGEIAGDRRTYDAEDTIRLHSYINDESVDLAKTDISLHKILRAHEILIK